MKALNSNHVRSITGLKRLLSQRFCKGTVFTYKFIGFKIFCRKQHWGLLGIKLVYLKQFFRDVGQQEKNKKKIQELSIYFIRPYLQGELYSFHVD
jgi:hypothetical protein